MTPASAVSLAAAVLLTAALPAFVFAACDAELARSPAPRDAPSAGTLAPDFVGHVSGRDDFRLRDHRGQVVLLDFWSTTCEPCRAELPQLQALSERAAGHGLLVVGVAMDGPDTSADVTAFLRRFAIDFPVVLDEDGRIARIYDPKGAVPLNVLVDRTGRIASVREGYSPGDAPLLEDEITRALEVP